MKKIIALLLIVNCVSIASAKSKYSNNYGSDYDYKTGNSYNWNTNSSGDTNVYGHNYKTGSNWNTTIDNDGDMSGRDANGNNWNYDSRTKIYHNYGTGETKYHY